MATKAKAGTSRSAKAGVAEPAAQVEGLAPAVTEAGAAVPAPVDQQSEAPPPAAPEGATTAIDIASAEEAVVAQAAEPAPAEAEGGAAGAEPAADVSELVATEVPDAPAAPAEVIPDVFILVTGPKKGRRRAGRQFGPVPVRLRLSDLSEAEQEAIGSDNALTIDLDEPAGD